MIKHARNAGTEDAKTVERKSLDGRTEPHLGAVYKRLPANGEGVVLKFRTFLDGGRGVVCESSNVRKFLKKS